MKNLTAILCLFITCSLHSQNSFSKLYGMQPDFAGTAFKDIIIKNDTLIIYGSAFPNTPPDFKLGAYFLKMDTLGNILSHQYYPETEDGGFATGSLQGDLISTSDGGYVFIGQETFSSFNTMAKLKHSGELEFYQKYDPGPDNYLEISEVVEVSGGYLVGGFKQIIVGNDFTLKIFLMKTDKAGNLLWEKTYGTQQYTESLGSLIVIDDNHIVIGANRGTDLSIKPLQPNTFFRGYMIHVDSMGNILQEAESPNNQTAGIIGLTRMSNGWLFGTAETYLISPYTMGGRMRVARTGEDINDLLWELEFPQSDYFMDYVLAIEPTSDGHYVALAKYRKPPLPPSNPPPPVPDPALQTVATMKFTANGEMLWFRTDTVFPHPLYKTTNNHPSGLAVSSSGSIYVVAYANSIGYDPTRSYAWLLKITPDGCIDTLCGMTTGLHDALQQTPEALSAWVYPNPASSTATVVLGQQSANTRHLWIEFYDMNGRKMFEKGFENQGGYPQCAWDVSGVPDGIYMYRILGNDKSLSGKVIVLK